MDTMTPVPAHPILGCTEAIESALKDVVDVDPMFMRTDDKAEALVRLARLESQLAALRMRVMTAAGDVADQTGAKDVASWLARRTHQERGPVWGELRLADGLERYWPHLQAGVTDGRVNLAQATVIVRSLTELPDDLDPDLLTQAEQTLVDYADRFAPTQLRALGRKILTVVAPDIADDIEAKNLANEEKRAEEATSLTLKSLGNGTTRLTGKLPDATAARLRTLLESLSSPRHQATLGATADHDLPATPVGLVPPADRVPRHKRLGQALRVLLERISPDTLPHHGGDTTTVMITIPLAELQKQHGVGDLLDTEAGRITAAEARRLACNAHIIPAVLGTDSEILDLGRASRLFSPAQRKALRLRDRHCRAEGCTVPATWCEAHHRDPWSNGGNTDLDDGILLCAFHHHRVHDVNYAVIELADGDWRFSRRV